MRPKATDEAFSSSKSRGLRMSSTSNGFNCFRAMRLRKSRMRDFIAQVALLVKVMARMDCMGGLCGGQMQAKLHIAAGQRKSLAAAGGSFDGQDLRALQKNYFSSREIQMESSRISRITAMEPSRVLWPDFSPQSRVSLPNESSLSSNF